MALTPDLLEVWCETQDDVTLIWKDYVEFVQAKKTELNQLWSISLIAGSDRQTSSTSHRDAESISILEKSLQFDQCAEPTRFRIVTASKVMKDLRALQRSVGDIARA